MPKRKKRNRTVPLSGSEWRALQPLEKEWQGPSETGLSAYDRWHQEKSRKRSSGQSKKKTGEHGIEHFGWFPSKKKWKIAHSISAPGNLASQFEKKAENITQRSRAADEKRWKGKITDHPLWGSSWSPRDPQGKRTQSVMESTVRGLYPYKGKVSPLAKKKAGVYKAYADTLRTRRKKPFKVDTSGNIKGKI